ncbi:30S ribosomal subunit protein S4 [Candidatus Tremblaya phenacola PAVE]|nr:30S ribosomal subunit protein S4 [Candidatus Tremblaya phenacola PAVE]
MSKYLGPKLKLSRREGCDLSLKSCLRSLESKCKTKNKPGQHTKRFTARSSNYNIRFREKQKLKRLYGMTEGQFVLYVKKASDLWNKQNGKLEGRRSPPHNLKTDTSGLLFQLLEKRLDNTIFRMGFGTTRAEARQIVSHKQVLVNGEVVNIPSFTVKLKDEISIVSKKGPHHRIRRALSINKGKAVPNWLVVDPIKLLGTIIDLPQKERDGPPPADIGLVLEFYYKTT